MQTQVVMSHFQWAAVLNYFFSRMENSAVLAKEEDLSATYVLVIFLS